VQIEDRATGTELAEMRAQLAALDRSLAVVEFEMDGHVLSANANFLEMMGYALDEIVGRHHRIFVSAANAASDDYQDFWTRLNRGEYFKSEYERIGKDGRIVWLRGSYNPVLDSNGQPIKVVKYAQPTTDAKLQAADFAGQIAAIGKSQAVAEFDLNGAVLSVNERFLEAFGYEEHEVVGRHHGMFVERQVQDSAEYVEFWAALRRGEFRAGEFQRLAKGRKQVWIQATYNPIFDFRGVPFKVVKYASDVSAAKLKNATYSGQIEAIAKSQSVIEFDLEGRVLWANPLFLNAMGYRLDEVVGKHHRMFVAPEDVSELEYERFWSALRAGEFHSGEYRRITRTGDEVWLQASYNPINDLNGRPFKIVKYAIDMSEEIRRKRREQEAQAARAVAEAAAAAKGDFLATMSHELRTPLTSILGFSRLIGRDSELSATDQRYLSLIHSAGTTLLAVVNDILDFSKLEAGAVELTPEAFSPLAVVHEVVAMLGAQAEEKGLALEMEAPEDVWLEGDPVRLRQVLINLSGNAVKFTHSGSVRLIATVTPDDQNRALLDLAVIDTGIGIAADAIPGLFSRFSQVDGSISRRFGGTGLGLAISRQLIELMGGEIVVESDGRTGSTFRIRLPLPQAEAPTGTVEDEIMTRAGDRSLRALLADDHAANRELLQALLSPFDIQMDLVEDGIAAVEAAAQSAYDIILLDMQMPRMDGPAAARLIRSGGGVNATTPIIALTANILPEHIEVCRDAGMQDHVSKPIDLRSLLAAIERQLVGLADDLDVAA